MNRDRLKNASPGTPGMTTLEQFLAAMAEEEGIERAEKLRKMIEPSRLVVMAGDIWKSFMKCIGGDPEAREVEGFGVLFQTNPYLSPGTIVSLPKKIGMFEWMPIIDPYR